MTLARDRSNVEEEKLDCFPFIVGCGRSGTTLLRSMLDSHPQVAVPPETYFVTRLAAKSSSYEPWDANGIELFVSDLTGTGGFQRMELDAGDLMAHLELRGPGDYADAIRATFELYAACQGKTRYADKTPAHVLSIPFLASLFPEARFIHIVRDGRDVALSFVDGGWAKDLESAVMYWKLHVTRGRKAGRRLGGRYIEVRYEDLVADPRSVLETIGAFIDVPFHPAMLGYEESGRRWADQSSDPSRHMHLQQPLTLGLRNWRAQMTEGEAAVLKGLAGGTLADFGYEAPAYRHGRSTALLRAGWHWGSWQARRVEHRARMRLASAQP
jgi:hypothetical protein